MYVRETKDHVHGQLFCPTDVTHLLREKITKRRIKIPTIRITIPIIDAINDNFIARIYSVPSVGNGSRIIIWMRLKFRVFHGGGREEMSADIDCTSEIWCDSQRLAPIRAFRACHVIYNFHEIFTRRSRIPAKPRYSRNFANLATLPNAAKKIAHSCCTAPEFSALIKRERKTQISPLGSQYAALFEYVRWYQWSDGWIFVDSIV